MKNFKKIYLSILIACIGFIFFAALAVPVSACEPSGDPWYTAHVSFNKTNLPMGLLIDDSYGDGYNEFAKIKNDSSIPFYFVSKDPSGTIYPNSELPKGYAPMDKIVSGKAYQYWNQDPKGYMVNPGIDLAKQWILIGNPELDANNIQLDMKYEDNRPANFTVPPSQPFTFLGFQNNKPVTLTGTLSYITNKNYNPHASQPCLDHFQRIADENKIIEKGALYYMWWKFHTFIIVIFLLTLAAIALVIVKTQNITWRGKNLNKKKRVIISILIILFVAAIPIYVLYSDRAEIVSSYRNMHSAPATSTSPNENVPN